MICIFPCFCSLACALCWDGCIILSHLLSHLLGMWKAGKGWIWMNEGWCASSNCRVHIPGFGESLWEKMAGSEVSIRHLEPFCAVVFFFFLRLKWIQSWNIHVCCFIFRTQVRRGSPEVTPQQTGAGHSHVSRTVKRYPSSTAPITSNALPSANGHNHRHAHTQQVAYSNGQPHASRNAVTPKG